MARKATPYISLEEFQRKLQEWSKEQREFLNFLECEVAFECLEIHCTKDGSRGGGEQEHDEKKPYETASLLIVAPEKEFKTAKLKHISEDETFEVSVEEVEKQQISEFTDIFTRHPDLKNVDPDNIEPPNKLATVYSYDDMRKVTSDFMAEFGRKAKIASVYFNGHGESEDDDEHAQLSFQKPMQPNENLDTVLADFNAILQKSNTDELPRIFNVVFCQCYGHKYHDKENYDQRMRVRCLTSEIPDHCKEKWLAYKKKEEDERKQKDTMGEEKEYDMATVDAFTRYRPNIFSRKLQVVASYNLQLRKLAEQEEARDKSHKLLKEKCGENPEVAPKPTDFIQNKPEDDMA